MMPRRIQRPFCMETCIQGGEKKNQRLLLIDQVYRNKDNDQAISWAIWLVSLV
jgi:hypothetical protein